MFGRVVHVIVVIVYLVDHDRVFRELLEAPIGTGSCVLTCIPGLLQPVHTLPTIIQTCSICCTLIGISNVGGTCSYLRLGVRKVYWAPHRSERVWDNVVCTAARSRSIVVLSVAVIVLDRKRGTYRISDGRSTSRISNA